MSTTVPGWRNPAELRAALAYFEAGPAERDFSAIDANALWKLRRRCVYCDYCLPCPEGIEIGSLMRLLDIVEPMSVDGLGTAQRTLARSAGDCTRCGDCEGRCPFGVPVLERMDRAAEVFRAHGSGPPALKKT